MGNFVISTNRNPKYFEFVRLMEISTQRLNEMMKLHEEKYIKAKPDVVENLVCDMMSKCAIGTPFEGTVKLISGHKFPDILAGNFYGTEVKSTKFDKWESFGNSIFENTRAKDVEKIYLTFGKMSKPVEFISKPYENCISGIAVDHSPRYHIDMKIQEENRKTIFEEMNTVYDEFRLLPNKIQIDMIAAKTKENISDEESLWWHPEVEENISSPTIKLLSNFSKDEKEKIISEAYCFFPELFSNSNKKYNRYILWLITDKNIATGNARDGFSAGGQENFQMTSGLVIKLPAVIGRLIKYNSIISDAIKNTPEGVLKDRWRVSEIEKNRIRQWFEIITPVIVESNLTNKIVIREIFERYFDC